jgi:hypothetical protein
VPRGTRHHHGSACYLKRVWRLRRGQIRADQSLGPQWMLHRMTAWSRSTARRPSPSAASTVADTERDPLSSRLNEPRLRFWESVMVERICLGAEARIFRRVYGRITTWAEWINCRAFLCLVLAVLSYCFYRRLRLASYRGGRKGSRYPASIPRADRIGMNAHAYYTIETDRSGARTRRAHRA